MRKTGFLVLVMVLTITLVLACCSTDGATYEKISVYDNPQKALLVMDMQVDLIDENGKFPMEKAQLNNLIITVNNIIEDCHSNNYIIIYIRNIIGKDDKRGDINYATMEGTPGAEIDSRISIVSDQVYDKYSGSAFSNKDFENYLIQNQVNDLYLCGVMASGCVSDTALGAFDRNYKVSCYSNAVGDLSERAIENAIEKLKRKGINIIEF